MYYQAEIIVPVQSAELVIKIWPLVIDSDQLEFICLLIDALNIHARQITNISLRQLI